MSERDLHRAVAKATRECVESIQRIGFHLLSDEDLADDDDPVVIDWDAGQPNRLSQVVDDDHWPPRQEPLHSWDEDLQDQEEFDFVAA